MIFAFISILFNILGPGAQAQGAQRALLALWAKGPLGQRALWGHLGPSVLPCSESTASLHEVADTSKTRARHRSERRHVSARGQAGEVVRV